MDTAKLDCIVQSVLYEGYLLYPYRQATKNVKRWTFGSIYPRESREVRDGAERCQTRARCLVVGPAHAQLAAEIRFLHLIERRSTSEQEMAAPCWHECIERRVPIELRDLGQLSAAGYRQPFQFPQARWSEPADRSSEPAVVARRQAGLQGLVEIKATAPAPDVHLLSITISNESSSAVEATARPCAQGEDALLQSLASAHLVLGVQGGEFVSRFDPPDAYRDLLQTDPGDGLWPVLVGEEGQRHTLLCSPIILYDYPGLAPESAGDFFDATEIDEMLTLRIMTLADDEKRAMAALDARGRALLDRTQNMAERQLAQLHGAMRSTRTIQEPRHGQ
ncbi:MAG TPA: hypothetical protein VHV08_00530 [Pirellulales bacterium]|nr:hypothetical protein [Pirellulales bacterium]